MSATKRQRQTNMRKRWVVDLRCKWDLHLGRDNGCHNAPWPCETHPREATS